MSRSTIRDDSQRELREAMNGDACLALEISTLAAICWHLEHGYDNAKIGRDALAKVLRVLQRKLEKAQMALANAEKLEAL
jgi:hypothetical protein